MEKEELQKQIAFYYSKLPKEAQEVFARMEWLESLRRISQKYGLNEAQIQTLGTETTLAMLGIVSLNDYQATVKKEIGLGNDSVERMLGEINESVLGSIQTELDQAFKNNSDYKGDETLDSRFDNLSEKTRRAIMDSGYYRTLYDISKEFNLNVTQMGELEALTTDVVTGAMHPDKFESTVKNKIGLTEDQARQLVNTVNEKILRRIRENLVGAPRADAPTTPEPNLDLLELEMPKHASPIDLQPKEHDVLKEAGIHVISTGVPAPNSAKKVEIKSSSAPEKPVRNASDMAVAGVKPVEPKPQAAIPIKPEVKKVESAQEKVNGLLSQKLSGSFHMPGTKTEHFSANIINNIKPVTSTETRVSPSYAIKGDPYRLPPE